MKILEAYTGNAMLNNALMTVEALGKLNNVMDISTEVLLNLYKEKDLISLNKRLKSYTMLFTKNGPLYNDKSNGEKVYDSLFRTIIECFEKNGEKVCEISGLKFSSPFEKIYAKALQKLGYSDKEIQKKDISINRGWFPLIGGLGSDAQALPQAKFSIEIHPICIAILQFLPLSALLYKGGILLIDSSNFEFTRSYIKSNVKEVEKRIQTTSSTNPVENIKDFSKGNYLLKAIKILEDKKMEEEYSDLNLWSFSNAGTGARCEIERVPNQLIKKLMVIMKNPQISNELKDILSKNDSAYSFLESLESNEEWYLLYPNVFGSGKKKVEYEGVSVAFLENYFREIGSLQNISYAKYLAYLIDKYKSDGFAKYLHKRDAYKKEDFKTNLFAVLVKASENAEWDLWHHLEILDNSELVPIRNNFFNIHKIAHFYYYKEEVSSELPKLRVRKTSAQNVCEWIISFIQNDNRQNSLKKDLLSVQYYFSASFTNLFYRASKQDSLDLESILYALYDDNFKNSKGGLNSLLRIFFSQPIQKSFQMETLEKPNNLKVENYNQKWLNEIKNFVQDYQAYYFNKYENKETGYIPAKKFFNLINEISTENSKFLIWFYEAIEKTNDFLRDRKNITTDKWSEALLYTPNGEYGLSFTKFAIKFLLLKQYYSIVKIYNNTN